MIVAFVNPAKLEMDPLLSVGSPLPVNGLGFPSALELISPKIDGSIPDEVVDSVTIVPLDRKVVP